MDELLDLLNRDYERVILELANYARALMRERVWRGDAYEGCANGEDLILPGGQTADDVVLDIVKKVLEDSRTWDRERFPEIMAVLKGMIRSEISNAGSSPENSKATVVSSAGEDADERNYDFEEGLGSNHNNLDGASRLLPSAAQETPVENTLDGQYDELFMEIIEDTDGDAELEAVVLAIMDGATTAREIASHSSIPIERVYELNRKMTVIAGRITRRVALRNIIKDQAPRAIE